ncbi:uncharacterized protein PV06_02480 [Exophiala oligosperma]|uniref:BHLH domain-containing protein n=1 Tax=Exophiala oligosperma TaxID=215243 RepID=A0A0D2DW50_9EURO|nr:uncharacterized protein PV06_02480 [Exophiala oligosperma]KIW46850.1 hypothetical protein PV06_02480 [Exophiala oligosperma]
MPRPRPPPTPTGSTDLKALEKAVPSTDMESTFTLPPPALRAAEGSTSSSSHATKSSSSSREHNNNASAYSQSTPPISPQDKPLSTSPRNKRTASGAVKAAHDPATSGGPSNSSSYALPPPPSRARKIIQMKPKSAPSPDSDASYHPPTSAANASNSASKTTGATAASKRKQPSATSAAGRKIARKTAHSIIERRRRSKMNEEFGVLKDMIPACEGVEMHKLAILQAGIEYVRYLEGCVAQLKGENEKQKRSSESETQRHHHHHREVDLAPDENEEDEEGDEDEDEDEHDVEVPSQPAQPSRAGKQTNRSVGDEWQYRDAHRHSVASLSSSAHPSPHILSQTQGHSDRQSGNGRSMPGLPSSYTDSPSQISTHATSNTPTPTMLSPAFNSIHFSPDLTRSQTNTTKSGAATGKSPETGGAGGPGPVASSTSTSNSWTTVNPSPGMAPLPSPRAALNMPLPPPMTYLQLPQPYNNGHSSQSQSPDGREAHSKSPAALSDASGTAEATAGAALMMLTNDWRGSVSGPPGGGQTPLVSEGGERGKGMSVRDLLSS